MKVAVDSFLGLHRRIQHLVDTPELLGPPVRYRSMIQAGFPPQHPAEE